MTSVICRGQLIRARSTAEAEVYAAVYVSERIATSAKAPHVDWRTDESSTENRLSCRSICAHASRVGRTRHLAVNASLAQDQTRSIAVVPEVAVVEEIVLVNDETSADICFLPLEHMVARVRGKVGRLGFLPDHGRNVWKVQAVQSRCRHNFGSKKSMLSRGGVLCGMDSSIQIQAQSCADRPNVHSMRPQSEPGTQKRCCPVRVSMFFGDLIRSVFSDIEDCQWLHNFLCIHDVLSALACMLVHHHATFPTIWRLSASQDFPTDFSSPRRHPPFQCPNYLAPLPTALASDVTGLAVFFRPSSRYPECLLSLPLDIASS